MPRIFSRMLIAMAVVALSTAAFARGGGPSTKWDPGLFGGGWVCFQAQVAGCSKGYNAACDGVTDDHVALVNFQNDAIAANPAVAKLYIPPSANCVWDGATWGGFNGPATHGQPGVQNLIVWMYGASVPGGNLGGFSFYPESSGTTSALIQQANIGDASVTLSSSLDASKFAPGDWIAVTGLSNQNFGFPPNFSFIEYKVITSCGGTPCSGTSISFGNGSLKNQYLTTWPDLGSDTNLLGGPARIYKMEPTWNTNSQYYGGRIRNSPGNGVNISGRDIAVYDLSNGAGYGLASNNNIFLVNDDISSGSEFDKDNVFGYFYRIRGSSVIVANGSDNTYVFDTVSIGLLNGTTKNTTINNSTITSAFIGPTGYGFGNSLTLNGTTIGSTACSHITIDTSHLTFSSGTFSIAKADSEISNAYALFAPVGTHQYAFADSDGTRNDSLSPSNFHVTSVGTSGANVTIGTDLGSSLPSSTCNVHSPCPAYVSWPLSTLTMINSTAPGISTCAGP
jgi:hypothetical protein